MIDQFEEFNIEFTYKEYQAMSAEDKKQIYFALYALFNNEALAYDMTQREVFDLIFEKTLDDQHYEFTAVLRDFKLYFEDDF